MVDVMAQIIVGVRLEQRRINDTVTRYNETTGKPYEKHVERSVLVIEGTNIEVPTRVIEDEDWDDADALHLFGSDRNYLGVEVASVDDDNRDGATAFDTTVAIGLARQLLGKLGHDSVSEFLILDIG